MAKSVFVKMFSSSELYYLTKLGYTTENVIVLDFVKSLIYSKVFLSRLYAGFTGACEKERNPIPLQKEIGFSSYVTS